MNGLRISVVIVTGLMLVAANTVYSTTPSVSELQDGFEFIDEDAPLREVVPYANWTRPAGPQKVALQVGHWMTEQAPDELEQIRANTGASSAGYTELEVNQTIAKLTKEMLEAQGIIVEILPVTIPPDYYVDAFIAIHADGNVRPAVSGFKLSPPWRDRSGKAGELAKILDQTYAEATGLGRDSAITRNMRGYYAFNWRKYEHSIHPMTPAVILETGFLTSPTDRRVIVHQPEKSAEGIAYAVVEFLRTSSARAGLDSQGEN